MIFYIPALLDTEQLHLPRWLVGHDPTVFWLYAVIIHGTGIREVFSGFRSVILTVRKRW